VLIFPTVHAISRSNLSGTFTFAFSYYLGLEGFTYGKIFGIMACFLGAVCVGLNDSEKSDGASGGNSGESSAMGDSVAFFGAVCYGLYTTVLKYKVCTFLHALASICTNCLVMHIFRQYVFLQKVCVNSMLYYPLPDP